jgi:uncharacterized membrane protein YfcA
MLFGMIVAFVGVVAGVVAAIAGFGIGSLLTPLVALEVGAKLAVAVVSIPHLVATTLRFWMARAEVDWRVVKSFGLFSAGGGLLGAVLHVYASSRGLAIVFGVLLLFAGVMELSGLSYRMRFRGRAAWVAGAVSGALGGLVGNQGGIRSAALLGFDVRRESFVATATAIGLIVDAARVPVYLFTEGSSILRTWPLTAAATLGVVAGTVVGWHALRHVPERHFRRIVALLLLALGIAMIMGVGA